VRSPKNLDVHLAILKKSFIWFTIAAIITSGIIMAGNVYNVWHLGRGALATQTSLQLLFGLYRPLLGISVMAIVAGLSLMILTIRMMVRQNRPTNELVVPLYTSCLLVIVSQILGRILFYATHVRLGI
jgi:DMSO reductase anchor subunit